MTPTLPEAFHQALHALLGPNGFLTQPNDCWVYGYDNSRRHALPQAVAFPTTHDEVIEIVRQCYQHDVPIVGRGRASGTCGGTVPVQGGLVVSFERMNAIIQQDPINRTLVAQAGVLNEHVQREAKAHGLFWAPDPSSRGYCTIGGNLATSAAGPRALKYGTTRENVLGVKAVIGPGQTLEVGVNTTKGVVGYDLTRLLIGSEGTLGLITQATLKLLPLAQTTWTLRAFFEHTQGACQCIQALMSQSVIPCGLEFMDANSLLALKQAQSVSIPKNARALLIVEWDGIETAMEEHTQHIKRCVHTHGLLDQHLAKTTEDRQQIWAIRKALSQSLRQLSPHKINEDVVVPLSKLFEFIQFLEALEQKVPFPIVTFGHAGNGNLHVNLLADPLDPKTGKQAQQCLEHVFDQVLALGGTLSGEHGVGIEKRDFIEKEIPRPVLSLMSQIKAQFDPKGLFNPGKIFPLSDEG